MNADWLPDDLTAPGTVQRTAASQPSADEVVPDPWAIVSTLLAGPLVWGAAGWLADRSWGTAPGFTVAGILIGAVLAFYIVYVRFGRDER